MVRHEVLDCVAPGFVALLALFQCGGLDLALEPRLLLEVHTGLDSHIHTALDAAHKLPPVFHIKEVAVWNVERVLHCLHNQSIE